MTSRRRGPVKPRNHLAIVARQRNGGPMKHRNTPRGGAKNEMPALLEEHANTLQCYLKREDGQWYDLGNHYTLRAAFGAFPGPVDGSVRFGAGATAIADHELLGLRLTPEFEMFEAFCLADDIICWACGKWFKFVSELEFPDDDFVPSPITGSVDWVIGD